MLAPPLPPKPRPLHNASPTTNSTPNSGSAYTSFHPGELHLQQTLSLSARVPISAISSHLPTQHQIFHSEGLQFLPVTTLDGYGRPWVSMLCGEGKRRGWIECPGEEGRSMIINAGVWDGDPILENLRLETSLGVALRKDGVRRKDLISGIGLQTETRRRNKFAGDIVRTELWRSESNHGFRLRLDLEVNAALGLCPKYINVRSLLPLSRTQPHIAAQNWHLSESDSARLPDEIISFIYNADTAYLGTSYVAPNAEDEKLYPSRLGTNHRGGRAGFVRVRNDGRTLVLPNYAGNRLLNSLGNIHITPLASLLFPCFTSGSILYLTGTAETLFDEAADAIMPGMKVITTIRTTGYSFVREALPLRECEGSREMSPYCPPIRYLAEEAPPVQRGWEDVKVRMVRAVLHNDVLATYTFRAGKRLEIRPAQNVVLDLSRFIRGKSHDMMDWEEQKTTKNDDCVRTWTVSVPPHPHQTSVSETGTEFGITVRSVPHGFITPLLYRLISSYASSHPELTTPTSLGLSIDLSHPSADIEIEVDLRGIGGNLPVPLPLARCDAPDGRKLLWIAGGIGLTPFLSLGRYVAGMVRDEVGVWDVTLVVATREGEVMMKLVSESLSMAKGPTNVRNVLRFTIYLFDSSLPVDSDHLGHEASRLKGLLPNFVDLHIRAGRIRNRGDFWASEGVHAKEREVHICGPLPFIRNAMEGLSGAGVNEESVLRERFTY